MLLLLFSCLIADCEHKSAEVRQMDGCMVGWMDGFAIWYNHIHTGSRSIRRREASFVLMIAVVLVVVVVVVVVVTVIQCI